MNGLRLLRIGIGVVTALAPFGVMTACTVEVNGDNGTPDSGLTPTPTPTTPPTTTTPANDAGPSPIDSGAPPVDSGVDAGTPPTPLTPVRQLSYADRFPDVFPSRRNFAISGNGQRLVYSVTGNNTLANPTKVFVADVGGTSPAVMVDSFISQCGCDALVAISDDGGTIVSTDSIQIRVRDAATGASKGQLVQVSNEVSNVGLNSNGTEVYFVNRRDNGFPPPSNAPVQRGLYKMSTTGGTDILAITQLLSPNDVATLLSEPDPNTVFPFNGCGSQSLAFASNGSKLYVALQHKGDQLVVSTDNTGSVGSKKVVVTPVTPFVHGIAVTRDGATLTAAISNTVAPSFGEIIVVGGDGNGRKKIADAPNGCGTPMSITDDGANVNAGNTGVVYPTNGGERWPVLIQTGASTTGAEFFFVGEPDGSESRDMWMTPDGKRFVFLSSPNGGPRRIGVAELGTSTLPVPSFTDAKVSFPFVTRATATVNGSEAVVTVKASQSAYFMGMQDLLNGQLEGLLEGQKTLRDNGAGNDKTKDDLVFSSDTVYAQKDTVLGARILRVKAEAQDATTKRRTAFAVDYSGFEVKSQ